MRSQAEKIADDIYHNRIKGGTIDPVMTKLVAVELRKAVIKGFGADLQDISYNTPDYKMLSQLEKNLFHFSAARNYQEMEVMRGLMKQEDGSLKPFKAFKDDAFKAFEAFNSSHLATEYETAVASAQMAGKWVEFEKNKGVLPMLQYQTVGDSRVRESHAALDNVIKKVDDPFWELYYPPNGWNCRCDVVQLVSGRETPADQTKTPDDVPAIFRTNLAKNGQVFPKGHAYYDGVPEAELKKAEALRNNVYSQAYKSPTTKATVQVSNMADEEDFEQNFQTSKIIADNGESLKIRPHLQEHKIKNPELEVRNSQVADIKNLQPQKSLKNSIENNIKRAVVQKCEVPVLVIKKADYDALTIIRALNGALEGKRKAIVTEVWIVVEKTLIKITREEIAAKTYYSKLAI